MIKVSHCSNTTRVFQLKVPKSSHGDRTPQVKEQTNNYQLSNRQNVEWYSKLETRNSEFTIVL